MIITDSTYSRINLYLMIAVGSILTLLSIFWIIEYRQSEDKLRQEISFMFIQSINEEIKLKMEGEFLFIHRKSDLTVGKRIIKKQTIITADTTITKESGVSGDMDVELLKTSQTYLLDQNRLQPDILQQIFDSKLKENGLKVSSVILVRYDDNTHTSGDTTQLRVSYRIPVLKGGVFGELAYEGLFHYSPFTVFRLMSKSMLIVLFILEVLMFGMIIYLFIDKRKIKSDKIVKRGKYYYIGKTIFDTHKCELIGQKREFVTLPKKPTEMLLMFLCSEEFKVEKNMLKNTLWVDNQYTANQNLMSTINKLRNYLKEADCTFNIVTKKGDEYYELKYVGGDRDTKM